MDEQEQKHGEEKRMTFQAMHVPIDAGRASFKNDIAAHAIGPGMPLRICMNCVQHGIRSLCPSSCFLL